MSWKQFFKVYFQFAFNSFELRWVTPWFGLVISDGAKYYTYNAIWWGFDIHWTRVKKCTEGGLMFQKFHRTVFRELTLKELYEKNLIQDYRLELL